MGNRPVTHCELPLAHSSPSWGIPQDSHPVSTGRRTAAAPSGSNGPGVGDPHASPPTPSREGTALPGQPRTEWSMPAGLDTARRTAARVAAIRAPYPGTDTLAARIAVPEPPAAPALAPVVHLADRTPRGRFATTPTASARPPRSTAKPDQSGHGLPGVARANRSRTHRADLTASRPTCCRTGTRATERRRTRRRPVSVPVSPVPFPSGRWTGAGGRSG